jgi:hypothetical protein
VCTKNSIYVAEVLKRSYNEKIVIDKICLKFINKICGKHRVAVVSLIEKNNADLPRRTFAGSRLAAAAGFQSKRSKKARKAWSREEPAEPLFLPCQLSHRPARLHADTSFHTYIVVGKCYTLHRPRAFSTLHGPS